MDDGLNCPTELSLRPPLERSAAGHALLSLDITLPDLPSQPNQCTSNIRHYEDFARADWDRARALCFFSGDPGADGVTYSPLEDRLMASEPTELLQELNDHLHNITQLCVPTRRAKIPPRTQPQWMTAAVLSLIQQHRQAYKEYRRKRRPGALKRANKLKAKKRKAIAMAKKAHVQSVVEEAGERRSLWEVHRKLSGHRRSELPDLTHGGERLEKPQDKADALADVFESHFRIPTEEDRRELELLSNTKPALVPKSALARESDLEHYLGKVKSRKATGCDRISPRVLRELRPGLTGSLTLLFNVILTLQVIPQQWRRAWIAPVPKCPNPTTTSQFRPIAILDTSSKCFERHLLRLLRPYIQSNLRQYGFKNGAGCGDAFFCVLRDCLEASKAAKSTTLSLLGLDAKRAFDRITHAAIIRSLRRRQAPLFLLKLVSNWLQSREIHVRVSGHQSSWRSVPSGVPQGSLLGPSLFALAIDDVFHLPLHAGTKIVGYADDLLLLRTTATAGDQAKLQEDVLRVEDFLGTLGLQLNTEKCQVLQVSLSPRPAPQAQLLLAGGPVQPVRSMRYLGVIFDNRLNFEQHWSAVAASSKRALGAIARLVHFNERALRHLYQERVAAVFLHSIPFTPPTTQKGWRRVCGVASFAGHLISNNWRRHGLAAIEEAGLTAPTELCFAQAMRFLWKCRAGRRVSGVWLTPLEREGRVTELRSQGELQGHELVVHVPHSATWAALQPVRLLELWNGLDFAAAGTTREDCLRSLPALTSALPALFRALPPSAAKCLAIP